MSLASALGLGLSLWRCSDGSGARVGGVRGGGEPSSRSVAGTSALGPRAAGPSTPASREGHRVSGQLVEPESGPLAAGRVEFWCEDGRPIGRGRVDDEGWFSGPGCAEHTCVRLVHPVFEQPEPWLLDHDGPAQLEVSRAPSLLGRVVGHDARPLPDASLSLSHDDGRKATARTDSEGEFALALPGLRPCDPCDLEPGLLRCAEQGSHSPARRARMLVMAPDHAPIELDVALDSEDALEVVLPAGAAPITGVVRGLDGAAFDARTKILATNLERGAEGHHASVDDNGAFELRGLAEARYSLRAIRDGREIARLDDAGPGEEVVLEASALARGATLRISVVDDEGAAVAEVRVDGGPFAGQRSDADGRLEAAHVLVGAYSLRLRAPGCPVVRASVEVEAESELTQARIELPAGCMSR